MAIDDIDALLDSSTRKRRSKPPPPPPLGHGESAPSVESSRSPSSAKKSRRPPPPPPLPSPSASPKTLSRSPSPSPRRSRSTSSRRRRRSRSRSSERRRSRSRSRSRSRRHSHSRRRTRSRSRRLRSGSRSTSRSRSRRRTRSPASHRHRARRSRSRSRGRSRSDARSREGDRDDEQESRVVPRRRKRAFSPDDDDVVVSSAPKTSDDVPADNGAHVDADSASGTQDRDSENSNPLNGPEEGPKITSGTEKSVTEKSSQPTIEKSAETPDGNPSSKSKSSRSSRSSRKSSSSKSKSGSSKSSGSRSKSSKSSSKSSGSSSGSKSKSSSGRSSRSKSRRKSKSKSSSSSSSKSSEKTNEAGPDEASEKTEGDSKDASKEADDTDEAAATGDDAKDKKSKHSSSRSSSKKGSSGSRKSSSSRRKSSSRHGSSSSRRRSSSKKSSSSSKDKSAKKSSEELQSSEDVSKGDDDAEQGCELPPTTSSVEVRQSKSGEPKKGDADGVESSPTVDADAGGDDGTTPNGGKPQNDAEGNGPSGSSSTAKAPAPSSSVSSKPNTQPGKLSFGLKPTFRGLSSKFGKSSDDATGASAGISAESGAPKTSSFSSSWVEATKNKSDVAPVDMAASDDITTGLPARENDLQASSSPTHIQTNAESTSRAAEKEGALPTVDSAKDEPAVAETRSEENSVAHKKVESSAASKDADESGAEPAALRSKPSPTSSGRSRGEEALEARDSSKDSRPPQSAKNSDEAAHGTSQHTKPLPPAEKDTRDTSQRTPSPSKRNRRFGREPKRFGSRWHDADADGQGESDRKRRRSSERDLDRDRRAPVRRRGDDDDRSRRRDSRDDGRRRRSSRSRSPPSRRSRDDGERGRSRGSRRVDDRDTRRYEKRDERESGRRRDEPDKERRGSKSDERDPLRNDVSDRRRSERQPPPVASPTSRHADAPKSDDDDVVEVVMPSKRASPPTSASRGGTPRSASKPATPKASTPKELCDLSKDSPEKAADTKANGDSDKGATSSKGAISISLSASALTPKANPSSGMSSQSVPAASASDRVRPKLTRPNLAYLKQLAATNDEQKKAKAKAAPADDDVSFVREEPAVAFVKEKAKPTQMINLAEPSPHDRAMPSAAAGSGTLVRAALPHFNAKSSKKRRWGPSIGAAASPRSEPTDLTGDAPPTKADEGPAAKRLHAAAGVSASVPAEGDQAPRSSPAASTEHVSVNVGGSSERSLSRKAHALPTGAVAASGTSGVHASTAAPQHEPYVPDTVVQQTPAPNSSGTPASRPLSSRAPSMQNTVIQSHGSTGSAQPPFVNNTNVAQVAGTAHTAGAGTAPHMGGTVPPSITNPHVSSNAPPTSSVAPAAANGPPPLEPMSPSSDAPAAAAAVAASRKRSRSSSSKKARHQPPRNLKQLMGDHLETDTEAAEAEALRRQAKKPRTSPPKGDVEQAAPPVAQQPVIVEATPPQHPNQANYDMLYAKCSELHARLHARGTPAAWLDKVLMKAHADMSQLTLKEAEDIIKMCEDVANQYLNPTNAATERLSEVSAISAAAAAANPNAVAEAAAEGATNGAAAVATTTAAAGTSAASAKDGGDDTSTDSDSSDASEEYDPSNPIDLSSPLAKPPKHGGSKKRRRKESSAAAAASAARKKRHRKSSASPRFRFPGVAPKDEIAAVVKSFKCMREIRGQRERFKKICRGVIKKVLVGWEDKRSVNRSMTLAKYMSAKRIVKIELLAAKYVKKVK